MKSKPWQVVFAVFAVIISIALISWHIKSHIEEVHTPEIPSEPLQLGQMQTHIFEDMGFSIAYPLDWTELQSDTLNPVIIESKELCGNISLLTSVFKPYTVNSRGFQVSVDDTISFLTQVGGSTLIQKQSITYNGATFVEAIISDKSSFDYEIWNVLIFFLSNDEAEYSVTVSYCIPDCWEYYKDAIYTITSTYQFLD